MTVVNQQSSARDARGDVEQGTFGEAYEDFVSAIYVDAIRLGAPTRAGLRSSEFDDAAISVGTSELVARGLLTTTDDPDVWEVVPPREALPRYADTVERRMATTRATASQVEALWRRAVGERLPVPPGGVEMLAGAEAISNRIVNLHRAATRRLWWAIDGSPVALHLLEEAAAHHERLAVRETVERRLVLDTSLLESEAALEHVERSRAQGQAVAFASGLPFSALVADSTTAVVDLTAFDVQGEGSFEVRLAPPVQAIGRLLEVMWGMSTPYGRHLREAFRHEERLPLAERDQRILMLLTTGASDQVIARQSGVSVRTVERRVRYLMDHLGAATRFQAGVQAARRGWI